MLRKFKKIGHKRLRICFSILFLVCLLIPRLALAQAEAEVVNDFADYLLALLTGPISKIVAGLLLLSGVVNLLTGNHKVALYCAFAFLVLIFIPQLLEVFQG